MSTGMVTFNRPTGPTVESLQRELYQRNRELAEAQEDLRLERMKTGGIEQGVTAVRELLSPLYKALRLTFGEMDAMGISDASSPPSSPQKSAVWESWKEKLPGVPAKMIDALLLHGGLTQEQLRLHVRCARNSVTDGVYKLNKFGLIVKGGKGGKITLKEL